MQNNDQRPIVGAILVVGVLIAGAILLKGSKPPAGYAPIANNAKNTTSQGRAISLNDHIIGNMNAKIVIVEYSDLECPFCKIFHNTMHKVVANNNKVAWVYRHYPIAQLHPKAFHEAEATECAWEQGGNDAFWKYTDRLFEITPSNDGLNAAELPKIAEYVGLDVASFNTCLNSGKFKDKVQADIDDGNKAGVNGTPASFILVNGKVIDNIRGAQPYEAVMQQLSQIK
ncbi:MAG: DsbA family oxidoreductase [Parcubacteria group bacterium Gr01-1014_24]|nr:MAG: DsbA family oxidoreductase [Parcubacteria group bacterium Gr01-1014_24]